MYILIPKILTYKAQENYNQLIMKTDKLSSKFV